MKKSNQKKKKKSQVEPKRVNTTSERKFLVLRRRPTRGHPYASQTNESPNRKTTHVPRQRHNRWFYGLTSPQRISTTQHPFEDLDDTIPRPVFIKVQKETFIPSLCKVAGEFAHTGTLNFSFYIHFYSTQRRGVLGLRGVPDQTV